MAGTSPRLSGSNFVDKAHGIDSSVLQAFGDVLGHGEGSSMLHQNSVFHGLLKHVPWHQFDRLVEDHGADARVRRFSTKSQFRARLYGQLSAATSLREIVSGLSSHAARLYHLGAEPVRRSTLSDANAQRPVAVFTGFLAVVMKQAHRGVRRKTARTNKPIDERGA